MPTHDHQPAPVLPDPNDWRPPPFSADARGVLGLLHRRGGCMRVGPLLDASHLPPDALAEACNELAERGWVTISWRNPRASLPPRFPERFRAIDRVTTTSFGRWRYSVTWP